MNTAELRDRWKHLTVGSINDYRIWVDFLEAWDEIDRLEDTLRAHGIIHMEAKS